MSINVGTGAFDVLGCVEEARVEIARGGLNNAAGHGKLCEISEVPKAHK
jgi:hypothetical protein